MRLQTRGGDRRALVRVAVPGGLRVGRPSVGDDAASRLHVGIQGHREALRARIGDDAQPGSTEPPLLNLDGPREQHLPERATAGHAWLRTAEEALVNRDIATQPIPPGPIITVRYRCSITQAVWIEPSSISRRSWVAETPVLLLTSSHAAVNQTVSGVRVLSKIVPAVAETFGLQTPHSHLASDQRHPAKLPQPGQTTPSGQRSQST